MSAAVFVSYRRADADGHAGRLFDRLAHWFDEDALFYDRASIESGDQFPRRLNDGIAAARCVLVLIGPAWLQEMNRRAGLPGQDFVRLEVEAALQRLRRGNDLAVIPVLLGGARPPAAAELAAPLRESLEPLLSLDMHSFQGKNDDWDHQFFLLRKRLESLPGVPSVRFRVPRGAKPKPFRTIGQSVSRHFSDPEDRLGELRQTLLNTGGAAVVSSAAIYGMGGVGKTQLALRYSHVYRDGYACVWWLRAETDETLQLDALDACGEVDIEVQEGVEPARVLRRWLESASAAAAPWLLVFDNADDPAALRDWLPERGGHHLLITSRNPAWSGIAQPVATGTWTTEQGAAFLAHRLASHPDAANHAALRDLTSILGGLPLALEQGAGFLDETRMAVADYARQARNHEAAPLLLDEGRTATGYERSVLATLSIAFSRLPEDAAQLLRLLAFCAPDPVPEHVFLGQPEQLPTALAKTASQPLQWEKMLAVLRRLGLVERTIEVAPAAVEARGGSARPAALLLHRLTQEVSRHRLADARHDADAMLRMLQAALPADVELPANWPIFAALTPHVQFIDRISAQVPVDWDALSDSLTRVAWYLQAGPSLCDVAHALLERALRLSSEHLGSDHLSTLNAMHNLSAVAREQGDLATARALQEEVLAAKRRVAGEEHPDTLSTMDNLALMLQGQGDLVGARAMQEQVLAARRRVLGQDHPDTLASVHNLAITLYGQGEVGAARQLNEKVLLARRHVLGSDHPDTLKSMHNLAMTLSREGDEHGARALDEEVLVVRRRVLGEEHPDTLKSMINIASRLYSQGNLDAARALQEQALTARRRVLGEEHPDTLMSIASLASTLYRQGNLDGACALQEQALTARRRVLGEEHPDTLDSMNRLGWTLMGQRLWRPAHALLQQVLEVRRHAQGVEHPDTLDSMCSLAELYRRQGDKHKATPFLEHVWTARHRHLGAEHPDTLDAMENLALSMPLGVEALRLLGAVSERTSASLGADHPTSVDRAKRLSGMRAIHEGRDPTVNALLQAYHKSVEAKPMPSVATREGVSRMLMRPFALIAAIWSRQRRE